MGPSGLAMREGIAVVLLGGMCIFELSGGDYVARNVYVGAEGLGGDIDISNRRILLGSGDCAWNGVILEFSTANNRWQNTTTLPGESKDGCDDRFPWRSGRNLRRSRLGAGRRRVSSQRRHHLESRAPVEQAGRTALEWLPSH